VIGTGRFLARCREGQGTRENRGGQTVHIDS